MFLLSKTAVQWCGSFCIWCSCILSDIIKSPKRTNPLWTFWYAVGPVTQYRKVHRTFLPNFFALLKIWTLVFESLQPEIIKIAKQINIYFAFLVRVVQAYSVIKIIAKAIINNHFICFSSQKPPYSSASVFVLWGSSPYNPK